MNMRIGKHNQSSLERLHSPQRMQTSPHDGFQITVACLGNRFHDFASLITQKGPFEFQVTTLHGFITIQNIQTCHDNFFMTHAFHMPNTLIGRLIILSTKFIIHNLGDNLQFLTTQWNITDLEWFHEFVVVIHLFVVGTKFGSNGSDITVHRFQIRNNPFKKFGQTLVQFRMDFPRNQIVNVVLDGALTIHGDGKICWQPLIFGIFIDTTPEILLFITIALIFIHAVIVVIIIAMIAFQSRKDTWRNIVNRGIQGRCILDIRVQGRMDQITNHVFRMGMIINHVLFFLSCRQCINLIGKVRDEFLAHDSINNGDSFHDSPLLMFLEKIIRKYWCVTNGCMMGIQNLRNAVHSTNQCIQCMHSKTT
mmetsp:Transcript_10794/g.25024  ORF Transcript_10794/g.25024 Transcript_10794/m.25024 type:complete len:365 (+) Transcript_10794:141-1235(+)